MNELCRDAAELAAAETSLGLTLATDVFAWERPDAPDLVVSFHDSPGEPPDPNNDYDRCMLQMVVRGASGAPGAAWTLARAVRDWLRTVADETINGSRIIGVWVQADIGSAGRDEGKRPLLSATFRVHRTTA